MKLVTSLVLFTCILMSTNIFAQETPGRPTSEQIETGRQIYEYGMLPNQTPLRGHRVDGLALEGSAAACSTCHRRSGMGSLEGSLDKTLLVPPVMGQILFAPARFAGKFLDPSHHYIPNEAWNRALTRPAYTPASFARALRNGIDPANKPLVAPMLRYDLEDDAIAALIAYLQQLSMVPAPGVTDTHLHIATVITPDVTNEEAEAVLDVLQAWSTSSRTSGKPWQLHIWKLVGPIESWHEQLLKYNRTQPVFALLSGMGMANWLPIHQFCETQRLPCLLPSVEVTPETKSDYYSVYYSPGVPLEAQMLVRHLQSAIKDSDVAILQLYSDATGQRAADIVRSKQPVPNDSLVTSRFRVSAPASSIPDKHKPDILILWMRPTEIEQLIESWPQDGPVDRVYLSALLAPPGSVTLPTEWKAHVSYISLFDDLGVQGQIARIRLAQWLDWHNLPHGNNLRLQADAYSACYLFSAALAEIRSQEVRRLAIPLSREHVLETLENLVSKYDDGTNLVNPDSHIAYYGHMSLGPTQRIAVRGGVIFRYAATNSDKLEPVSERIVP